MTKSYVASEKMAGKAKEGAYFTLVETETAASCLFLASKKYSFSLHFWSCGETLNLGVAKYNWARLCEGFISVSEMLK